MKFETRRQLKDKTWHASGLLNVLKSDFDYMKKDVDNRHLDKLSESIQDVSITLRKLMLIVGELEYILKLDKTEGP